MSRRKKPGSCKLFAALFAAALLGGCSASVESFLSPPKLSGEQSAIYEALRSVKGGDIHLKYPKSGQYRSAFVVKNIDGEETDEAIVFYEASNIADNGSSLRLNFLDMDEGRWVSVYDFAALGSEVERVQFADLGDGETSLIITYTIQNSSDSAVSVLKYSGGKPTEVYAGRCAYMQPVDLDENGSEELLLLTRDLDTGTATALLLGWSDPETFRVISAAPLGGFAECRAVTFGTYCENGGKALFIDRAMSDGTLGTDVLICSGRSFYATEALKNISRRTNSYTPDIISQDIDGDGIIEAAHTAVAPGYENLSRPEQVNLVSWYQLRNGGRAAFREELAYLSIRSDYLMLIPTRWEGRVTVSVSISEGRVSFSEYSGETQSAGEELLSIKAAAPAAAEPEGYELLGESEATGYRFYALNNTGNSLALTDAELADCFRVIS